ncbi:unnamed protein product [Closterium sp. NIES-54]
MRSFYFNTAFLQRNLHEEIWLRRLPCFTGSFPTGTQWSPRWPVYGLRHAPFEWHDTLRTTLVALESPSTAHPSLFLRTDTSLLSIYVLVYVDDLVFATADTEALALVKSELQKRHTCTDLGELRSHLGLQITRDRARRTITLTQSHMVHQVLQRFSFQYSLPQSTPLPTGHSLSAPPSDKSVEPSGPYPELVGFLMYVMTCTRPDLAYPLSIMARYVAPGRHRPEHWEASKWVLRYLCSTSGIGLVLGGRGPVVLTGHADASWVDDLATQRSSEGYTFSLGSGCISWRSTRSFSVLSSSCEAEIYAGAMASQELRWLSYLLTDLGERPRSSPVLYVDNKAMIALYQEHRLEHRTKHIALRYFLARELQQRGQLCLSYVATRANTADIFTKALQSVGHIVADNTTTLLCPAAPSGFTRYYTPLLSRNMVGVSSLHDLSVVTTFLLDEPVTSCMGIRAPLGFDAIGAPLATFHRDPGSGLSPRVIRLASLLACTTVHRVHQGSIACCPSLLLPLHHGFTLATESRRAYRPRAVATSKGWRSGPLWAPPALGPWCHLPRNVHSLLGEMTGEGGGTGAAGPGGASSVGAGGVTVDTFLAEDMAVSTWRPCPTSHPGFPYVP